MSPIPAIDIVIIGLDTDRTLAACLDSIRDCDYPGEKTRVYYADGGSVDESLSIAASRACTCLVVASDHPTPGRQRNAGWRAGTSEYVQFLDSDTTLNPGWLKKAVDALDDETIGAVRGEVRELQPEASIFNWIGDLEWNGAAGDCATFGGIVMIPRRVLEASGGYDPDLIAGEDPELSYRVRSQGFRIVELAEPMVSHDLHMKTIGQYWRRSYRSGHAYAEVNHLHRDFWRDDVRRISVRAAAFMVGLASLPLAFLDPWGCVLPVAGFLFLIRPRLRLVGRFQADLGLSRRQARIYSWHASLVVLPQFFGMLRFHLGRLLSKPLSNGRKRPRQRTPAR